VRFQLSESTEAIEVTQQSSDLCPGGEGMGRVTAIDFAKLVSGPDVNAGGDPLECVGPAGGFQGISFVHRTSQDDRKVEGPGEEQRERVHVFHTGRCSF